MNPIEREQMKRRAEAKLAGLRERARRLRHRVLTAAAIGFTVLWVAIFAQMISGHDPVLGPATATVRPATQEGAGGGAGEDDHGEEGGDEEGSMAAPVEAVVAPPEEAEELEPATTSQS